MAGITSTQQPNSKASAEQPSSKVTQIWEWLKRTAATIGIVTSIGTVVYGGVSTYSAVARAATVEPRVEALEKTLDRLENKLNTVIVLLGGKVP